MDYKYQIYCNPGKGIYRCLAERYGAPEAYIRELYNKHLPPDKDMNNDAQYIAMRNFYRDLMKNFTEVRRYCDYCESRAQG